MKISADPNAGTMHYRRNFEKAIIKLDGEVVKAYECDTVAGWVRIFVFNDDGSIQMSSTFTPAFKTLYGVVTVSVPLMGNELPCVLNKLKQSQWWQKLL